MSREGRWRDEEEGGGVQPVEERATGERAAASQLRVNHSFYFSVRSHWGRGGGEVEGVAAGLSSATGKRKLIIRLWLLGKKAGASVTWLSVCVRIYEHLWAGGYDFLVSGECAFLRCVSVRDTVTVCVCFRVFVCVMSAHAEQHRRSRHCRVGSAGMINELAWCLSCRCENTKYDSRISAVTHLLRSFHSPFSSPSSSSCLVPSFGLSGLCDIWGVYSLPLWVCINNNVTCHCA